MRSELEQRYISSSYCKQDATLPDRSPPSRLKRSCDELAICIFSDKDADGVAYIAGCAEYELQGKPLALDDDGKLWTAVLLFIKGDMEFLCQEFGLGHYNKADICHVCLANVSNFPWTDFSELVQHFRTILSNGAYIARHLHGNHHGLLELTGVNRFTFPFDSLHILDHRGIFSRIIANTLYTICKRHDMAGYHTQESTLERTNDLAAEWQSNHNVKNRMCLTCVGFFRPACLGCFVLGSMVTSLRSGETQGEVRKQISTIVFFQIPSRMPRLRWSNIVSGSENSFPVLHGVVIKAANTRSYMPCIADLAEMCDDGSEFAKRRRQVYRYGAQLNEIWDEEGCLLTPYAARHSADVMREMLLRYAWLSRQASQQGRMLWGLVPKMHYASHIPRQSLVITPHMTRTYLEEGLVGRASEMYNVYLRGPYMAVVQETFLLKYVLGLQVQFGFGRHSHTG